ncbi:membrane protein insertion efficiency factor YidD [Candidatus Uhrbacteria bacterium]|nr:membrane protein insertion efficiency factor YidD [Candidatus Uhrbacteria bacterium]
MTPLAFLGVGAIRLYQKTLSPDHGLTRPLFPYGACRFDPTCSEYTVKAIKRYGFFAGFLRGGARICRCHPWSIGGHDDP